MTTDNNPSNETNRFFSVDALSLYKKFRLTEKPYSLDSLLMNETPPQRELQVLVSKLDPSVNFVLPSGLETRFVSRADGSESIIYLSSQKGCDRACRMCHLTQTGQTNTEFSEMEDFIVQADYSLKQAVEFHQKNNSTPTALHFNFMARGEPLLNPTIMKRWEDLSEFLIDAVEEVFPTAKVKFKISTIMSGFFEVKDDSEFLTVGVTNLPFKFNKPEIYYSLYSVKDEFRHRWLPKADDPMEALRILGNYRNDGGEVRIHSAFIQGQNDDLNDIRDMLHIVKHFLPGNPKFNIVRYNPFDEKSAETDEDMLREIAEYIKSKGFIVQTVEKVGFDVNASCGMFEVI